MFPGFDISGSVTDASISSPVVGSNGIGAVVVSLYEDNLTTGEFDLSQDTLIATTLTDTNGRFNFNDQTPGNYCVVVLETTLDSSFLIAQTEAARCFQLLADVPDVSYSYDRTNPVLGLALGITGSGVQPGSEPGRFTTQLKLLAENKGNTALSDLNLELSIQAQLPEGAVLNSASAFAGLESTASSLTLNSLYDGASEKDLLEGIDILEVDETIVIYIDLEFSPNANASFSLSAKGEGRSSNGNLELDISHEGLYPDPSGAGADNFSTPTQIKITGQQELGLALNVQSISPSNVLGVFDTDIRLTAKNTGNLLVSDTQVAFDLAAIFPDGVVVSDISRPLVSGDIDAGNSGFDGRFDTHLLSGFDALQPDETFNIDFSFKIDLRDDNIANYGPYNLTALVSGLAPDDSSIQDLSDQGVNPENNAGGAGFPTILDLSPEPKIALAMALTSGPIENAFVPAHQELEFDFLVQNTGHLPLNSVQVEIDLLSIFSSSPLTIPSNLNPSLLSYQVIGVSPELGQAADGQVNNPLNDPQRLLDESGVLAPGESGSMKLLVKWDSDFFTGPYEAAALATAKPPSAYGSQRVTDVSTDGADPDLTTPSLDPIDNSLANEYSTPTSISVPTSSSMGLALKLKDVVEGQIAGSFIAHYELLVQNTGNQPLNDLSFTVDLDNTFPVEAELVRFVPNLTTNGLILPSENATFLETGLLATADSLNIATEDRMGFSIEFIPNGAASNQFNLRIAGQGLDPINNFITDLSDNDEMLLTLLPDGTLQIVDDPVDGFDTDEETTGLAPQDNNSPQDNSDPTNLLLPERPSLGIAMNIGSIEEELGQTSSGLGTGSGAFLVNANIFVENLGNVDLSDVSLDLDLEGVVGGSFYSSPEQPINGSGPLPWNLAYTGRGVDPSGIRLISDEQSILKVGETALVSFQFKVIPDEGGFGPFNIQTIGTARSPDKTVVDDLSANSDLLEPDFDGDGRADSAAENTVTPIDLPLQDGLGLALSATRGVKVAGAGNYKSIIEILVQNVGNTPLDKLQIDLDFRSSFDAVSNAVFLGIATPGLVQIGGADLPINPAFNGDVTGDTKLISTSDLARLEVGAQAVFRMEVLFNVSGIDVSQNSMGPFLVSASGSAFRPGTNDQIGDLSQSGQDPDPDTPGSHPSDNPTPYDNNTPAEISIPGLLAIAKKVSNAGVTEATETPQGGMSIGEPGQFDVTFELIVANLGGETLSQVQVSDDLSFLFGSDAILIDVTEPILDNINLTAGNSAYNGSSNPDLLLGQDVLEGGATGTIRFSARFEASSGIALSSQAFGQAVDKTNVVVEDRSQNGSKPDPDEDGDPSNNSDPTVITPGFRAELGLAQKLDVLASGPNNNGPWQIQLSYKVQNFGNTKLKNLSIGADLGSVFGNPNVDWSNMTVMPQIEGTSTSIFLNNNFNGESNTNLLSPISTLFPGESATVNLELTIINLVALTSEIIPPLRGDYQFSSYATGLDPNGTLTEAYSTDGKEAFVAGDESDIFEEPTQIQLAKLNSSLAVEEIISREDGKFDVKYRLNIANTGAKVFGELQIKNDLRTLIGAPFEEILTQPLVDALNSTIDILPTSKPFTGEPTGAKFFDGSSGRLAPTQAFSMTFNALIDPASNGGEIDSGAEIFNQFVVKGVSYPDGGPKAESGHLIVTDLSDNGLDPASDNGAGGVDDETPLRLSAISAALEAVSIVGLPNGNHQVDFQLAVKNTGTLDLERVRVHNDLIAQFGGSIDLGGAFVSLTDAPFMLIPPLNPQSSISLAPNWSLYQSSVEMVENGFSSKLAAQDSFLVQFSVELDRSADMAPTPLTNQVEVSGEDLNGSQIKDLSDDGSNVYGINAYGGVDDPTPLLIYGTGVVYDAVHRIPVVGARVWLMNLSMGSVPKVLDASCLPAGVSNPQITGANGEYNLDVQFAADNPDSECLPGDIIGIKVEASQVGYFDLELDGSGATRGGVAAPLSRMIQKDCADDPSRDVVVGLFGCQIQASPAIPSIGQNGLPATAYHLSFLTHDDPRNKIFNNHIPLDPAPSGEEVVSLFKHAIDFDVSIGEFARWEIVVTNLESLNLPETNIIDFLPVGFIYSANSTSLTVDGIEMSNAEPETNGNRLTWTLNIPAEGRVVIKFDTVIGAGVPLGVYQNQAEVQNAYDEKLSERVSAAIRIVMEPVFDCADIIGKVYHDQNGNGQQDDGELGIANALIFTTKGKSVRADLYGRYSLPCVSVPKENMGSNFLVKLHPKSLPQGMLVQSENPRVVRLTRGRVTRADFALSAGRVLRMVVTDAAFDGSKGSSQALWAKQQKIVRNHLGETVTTLKITYRTSYATVRTRQRLARLEKAFKALLAKNKSKAKVVTEIIRTANP
ncbi:MAG: hypothetical protein ACPGVN_01775 [Alphaproteobacteria bacterium]